MAHIYHRQLNMDSQDSLAKLARLIPAGSEVLDVGSGPGILAVYLGDQKCCYVDGLEYDHASAHRGADAFRNLWVADLNHDDPVDLCKQCRYDVIICADILEHLHDPGRLLKSLIGLLKPHGRLVLSVPNIAYSGLIAELLDGDFRYRTEGLLDRTHIRFFTRKTLRELLDECGLHEMSFDTVQLPLAASEFSGQILMAQPDAVRESLLAAQDALTYQFIVEVCPAEADNVKAPAIIAPEHRPIDVVVSVYSGFQETRACLESVLASPVAARHELIVINDCSPEPAIHEYLAQLAQVGKITLLENERNLGFVASVNKGMRLHPDRDVVLLNSDVEVANDWLDRLQAAAYAADDIATVTPFANSGATICSYPRFCVDNRMPDGWDTAALDDLMRRQHSGEGVDIPTGVGYCLFIRRDCIEAVGLFDEEAFGRGYGEENDFCMRARYRGWRHRLAADVFVLHHGGISFGKEKAVCVEAAQRALRERHPAYDLLVAEHIRADPARKLRNSASWQRLAYSPRPRLLFISHALGGGVARHVHELSAWLEPQAEVLVLQPRDALTLELVWMRGSEDAGLCFARETDFDRLCELLSALQVAHAHVHHLHGLEAEAGKLLKALAIPYDVTIHDFRAVCPRVNLIDSAGRFCDQPALEVCSECLARDAQAVTRDPWQWRADQAEWLFKAARVLAPSQDTARRVQRIWPGLRVLVAPHDQLNGSELHPPVQYRPWSAALPLRIAVLGQLSRAKGVDVLAAAAQDAAARALPLEFHLIGHPLAQMPSAAEVPLFVHGPYAETELYGRLRMLAPHLVWFPACWPETWCYTLDACLQAGLPVVAPDLGAFPERLAGRLLTALVKPGLSGREWNDHLLDFAGQQLRLAADIPAIGTATDCRPVPLPEFRYADSYLESVALPAAEDGEAGALPMRLLADASEPLRPYALVQSSGDVLIDRLVQLREANSALQGGIRERDVEIARRLDDAARAWDEMANLRAGWGDLERSLEDARRRHQKLEEDARRRHQELEANIHDLAAALQRRDAEIDVVYHSLSWRLTRPVRGGGRVLRHLRARLQPLARELWHRLPLAPQHRFAFKSLVFRRASFLFRGTPAYSAWLHQCRWMQTTPQVLTGLPPMGGRPQAPVVERRLIPGGVAAIPRVSVVIPVYNNLDYTLACLDAIARHLPAAPIEVIIVDDASTDGTETELSVRTDLRYLRNSANLGFVGSCNRGAAEARGEFVFFLNNDTTVLEGWLDTLVATFDAIPEAGLVGSKLIYPDGRLQEAGGIVWEDASGWNWGRLADPAAPEFNFLRDVDYCSGAAILIRRELFTGLGGFDTRYAPAYYEDTDLAFAVRAHGLRVLYQPLSQVVHYEGVTSGTDLGSGIKAYQVRNRERFLDKWQSVLATHGSAEGRAPRLSADRRPQARMLVIDACTPTPDQDSGSIDMVNLLRMLDDFGYRVSFIPESDLLFSGAYTRALQGRGVECLYHPYTPSVEQVLQARGEEFDAVMLVRGPHAYHYVDMVKRYCPRAKIIFNTVDLHFLREQRKAQLETGSPRSAMADEMHRKEMHVIERADTTIVISPVEQELLAREAPAARVRVIPLLREIPGRSQGFGPRRGIVFVGGFRHPPNIDAMLWFCAEIWPLVRARLPDLECFIIGSHMAPEVQALEGNGVRVLGFVEDIEPVFRQVRLSIAPLRYGAGLKGKVATSLGYGVPCVLSQVAVEGSGLEDGVDVLVADSPSSFAAAIVRLHEDEALWERLSCAGLERVEQAFSVRANRMRLIQLLSELGLPAAAMADPCRLEEA